jgi:hypothetical protein
MQGSLAHAKYSVSFETDPVLFFATYRLKHVSLKKATAERYIMF